MSPIGRVFIVLNLILAGTFVGFAGTYLQKQDTWKKKFDAEKTAHDADAKSSQASIADLTMKLNQDEASKHALEALKNSLENEKERLADENKRLDGKLSSLEGSFKGLDTTYSGMGAQVTAAIGQLKDVSTKLGESEKSRDDAIRDKDDAVAKLKDANQQIAALTDAGQKKDIQIADLGKKQGELQLLVDVAHAKGFIDMMATPPLAGTVSLVNGKLVTIAVTNNPNKAEIKPGYTFAISDGNVYKGEARVTSADGDHAFATMTIIKGTVKEGDLATTNTN
jgi:hypothetical protein